MIVYLVQRSSAREPAAARGALVYEVLDGDFGMADEDTVLTGRPHVSVTLDPDGKGPTFTMPVRHLRVVRRPEEAAEMAQMRAALLATTHSLPVATPALSLVFGRPALPVSCVLLGLTALIFGLHPRLDFHASDLFEDMRPSWDWHHAAWARHAHVLGHMLETLVLLSAAAELLRKLAWPDARLIARASALAAVLLIGCVGPSLVGYLPEAAHLARPRPYGAIESFEHGDSTAFRPWWSSAQTCQRYCEAATSRDVASAAVTVAAAAILPGAVGLLATGLALIFTVWTALLRVGVGEAYLSDVLFAALLLHILACGVFRALGNGDGGQDAPDPVERWLGGARLRVLDWRDLTRTVLARSRQRSGTTA